MDFFLENGRKKIKECEGNEPKGNAEAFRFPVFDENQGPSDGEPAVRERGTHYQFNLQYCKPVSHPKSFEEAGLLGILTISLQSTAGQVLWWVDSTAYIIFS